MEKEVILFSSPEPFLSKLVPSHLFYFSHLECGQMSMSYKRQNMELSSPGAKLATPEAQPPSVPAPGTGWTLSPEEAPGGWLEWDYRQLRLL